MKVLQLLPALNSGGVERGTLEIAKALIEAGHESYVMSAGGRLVEQLEREGSTHITRPIHRKSLTSLLQILPLRRLLRELKPDIVHARSRIPAWIAWLALRGMDPTTRPRFITTVHGLNSVSPYSAIMTKGDAVIVVSQTVYDFVRQNYPSCPPEKLHLIYRGVDPEEFPFGYQPSNEWLAQWHSDFPELAGKTILALPGRITRLKGHETFLKLLAELLPRHPQIHGLIIGGAEAKKTKYLDELKALVAHLGLDGRVTFTGHRSDMRDALSQCNVVFALSTKPETFGRAVLETLRLGVPVIGWDVGGVGEILRAVYPEGAATPKSVGELYHNVSRLIATPAPPTQNHKFQLQCMCAETLHLYERVTSLLKATYPCTGE
ncbi:glycosyltransferase involved in cell wall biosynthesis [Paraperlucidibaca baekdonensis]|uniref:Glycosyltransferase involved in cell wall biosynthesis n=1 Tax=Paraperlucidibaca baekdonensis TaxID=748120 RepID=A0A3E0H9S8_9GAMM|nr:glycosyltransferase family 4 protein [Paraperlucidibaca baekdonensis]REH40383.1 glycosyltransferase involved in cell wall biosynthesis [Paraperlucidibaca baekdonensis]